MFRYAISHQKKTVSGMARNALEHSDSGMNVPRLRGAVAACDVNSLYADFVGVRQHNCGTDRGGIGGPIARAGAWER